MLNAETRGWLNVEDVRNNRPPVVTDEQAEAKRCLTRLGFRSLFGQWMCPPGRIEEAIYQEVFRSPLGQTVIMTFRPGGDVEV